MYQSKYLLILAILFTADAISAPDLVRVNHWDEFLAEGTTEEFTKATGTKVDFTTSHSMEELAEKIDQGKSGYDTITPSHALASTMIKKGQLLKLDKKLLPNLKNLDPAILKRLEAADPGNQYLIPFSFTGIILGYNQTAIQARLGEEMPSNKLELLFNPHYSERLKDCGINLLDFPSEAFSMALAYIGKNPLSVKDRDQISASKVLNVARPNIRSFDSDVYIKNLADGEICLTTGFTSDIILAQDLAKKANRPYVINYSIVPDQSPASFTVLAIPRDAEHAEAALEWINYLLDAQVSAKQTVANSIATGNQAATKLLPIEVQRNPLLVISSSTYRKFYMPVEIPAETLSLQERLWQELKN